MFTKLKLTDKINLMEMVKMKSLNKENQREVPIKNYVYLFIILLGSILLLIYIYTWYETYKESKLNISIMNDYLTVINYNELEDYIIENKDAVLYVSVLGDSEINKFEEKFKNTVMDNDLRDKILYLDLTNENKEAVRKDLEINQDYPYLVVYTNGEVTDTYNIQENQYNPKKIIKYLNRIGAIEND